MKRKAENDLEKESKKPRIFESNGTSIYDVIYTSIIPALMDSNSYIFDQRNTESVRGLFIDQCEKYTNHLVSLLQPQMSESSHENFKKFIEAKGSLGIDFLRDHVAVGNDALYFIGLQYLKSVAIFDKIYDPQDIKKSIEVVMNFMEWKNTQILMVALFAFLPSFEKPTSSFNPEIKRLIDLFEGEIDTIEKLQEISSSAHNYIYPFYPFMEEKVKIRKFAMSEVYKIIMQEDVGEKDLEVALCLFGNLIKTGTPEELKYKFSLDQASNLYAKHGGNSIVMQNISFIMRNFMVLMPAKDTEQYKALFINLFSHPDLKVVLWVMRAYGAILERNVAQETVSPEEILKLFYHKEEAIAAWALSFIGTFVTQNSYPTKIYPHVLSFLQEQLAKENKSASLIEATLRCLGSLAAKEVVKEIPDEVLYFLDANILSVFPQNGEKIILFASRCLSNLTSAHPSKIPISSDILNRVMVLLDAGNEKISVWAICFLGTISSNTNKYNAAMREHIASSAEIIRKLFDLLNNNKTSSKILEAILWSFHKIMWSENSVTSLRLLGGEKLVLGFLEHPAAKVKEGALLCFSLVATRDTIKKGLKTVIKLLRSPEQQVRLIACRSLNTLVTAATPNSQVNRQILAEEEGIFEELASLLYENDAVILESAFWCLGNLALRPDNVEKIYSLAFDKAFEFLDSSNPVFNNMSEANIEKVVAGASFCFCNLVVETSRVHNSISSSCGDLTSLLFGLLEVTMSGEYKCHPKALEGALYGLHKLWTSPGNFNLTDHYDLVQNNEGFEKIGSLLDHPNGQVLAGTCWCLNKLIGQGIENKKARPLNLASRFFNIIERNSGNPKLIVLALRCIGTLSLFLNADPSYLEEIGARGIRTMLELLSEHNSSDQLIETCIWTLASQAPALKNQTLFLEHNASVRLRELFQRRNSNKITEGLLHTLNSLYANNEFIIQATEPDIDSIVRFIIHSKDNIAARAQDCLNKLIASGVYGKKKSVEAGMALLMDLLFEHKHDELYLRKTCCRILASLLSSSANQSLFVKYAGFTLFTKLLGYIENENNIKILLLSIRYILALNESILVHVTPANIDSIVSFKNHANPIIAEYAKRSLRFLSEKGLYHGAL